MINPGFQNYLTEQGWDGEGKPWQYAQQLRAQGQHPRWDYRHPGQEWPGGLGALQGQIPQMQQWWQTAGGGVPLGSRPQNGGIMPPGMGSPGPNMQAWNQPPHTMAPMQSQGLAGLAGRMKKPVLGTR